MPWPRSSPGRRRAASESSDRLYAYRPVSKWHLEPTQGLEDSFLRWAWPQLEAQDQAEPVAPIAWRAVWRIEGEGNARVLRYLSADPASQAGCVGCHNACERRPEVRALRAASGVAEGKQWREHQLMGALSVTIPLENAEELAGIQINQTTIFIFGILITSFGAMAWFQRRLGRQERDLRRQELKLVQSEHETRTANALLRAKQGVEEALAELSTYTQAIDQHAIVSVAGRDGRIIQVNEKLTQVSGYGAAELIGQDHRILSSGTHDRAFFAEMWRTLVSGQIWRGIICNRRKSGELYWVDSAIVPVKDPDGRIARYVSIRIDVTERMRTEQQMQHLASHDNLTGLVNRAVLRERIDRVLQGSRRPEQKAAVLFIDLDQFKSINDSLGHETGDHLLIEVARRLQACVRSDDTVARQGGDEFIVFMPVIAGRQEAAQLAERLTRELARPFRVEGQQLYVGSSIGIALFPDHGRDVDTLLKHSDTAMYHVKSAGRNHHAFFDPRMTGEVLERYALGMGLRRAVELDEFELHYQPVIGVGTGQVEGLEALLRWRHPERGLVSPLQFIAIAESSGLIVPIGDWVLRATCRQIRAWRDQGLDVPRVAVNLSILQLQLPDIVERIDATLRDAGLPPEALGFEGVETPEQLAFLRDQGCQRFQGYLASRPLPADEMAHFLQPHASMVIRTRR